VDRIYIGVGADKAVVVGERELSVTVKLTEGGEPQTQRYGPKTLL
jgi:hypothetical protein